RMARIANFDLSPYRRDLIPVFAWVQVWRGRGGLAALWRNLLEAGVIVFFLSAGFVAEPVGAGIALPAGAAAVLLGCCWFPKGCSAFLIRLGIFAVAAAAVFAT